MGSSIGPAFTYLLANLPAALMAVDSSAAVFDGWPTDRSTANQFVIGRSGPANETSAVAGVDALTILGAGRVDEDYEIPCYIQTYVGGDNQAEARNAALVLWDAFMHFLSLDRTLGGALTTGGWAEIGHIQIEATPEENVESGRFCLMTFSIHCKNKYIP